MKIIVGLILSAGLFTLVGCQQEDDCIGCNLNPKVKIKFEAVSTREVTEQALDTLNKSLKALQDALKGELTEGEKNEINAQVALLKVDSAAYGQIFDFIKAGKTQLDAIIAPGAEQMEQFQDTVVRDFALPVDMSHDTSTYYFNYFGKIDTLQLYYQRAIVQTLDGMRMKIYGIGVNAALNTFDSARVRCYDTECANNLTTVYVYY
ncbi:MAG: hypothetical protein HC819_05315 [Cyclobacteriaceae bacterium]|nr:hypothetical protein [Cyclobacteriaceae bacterium]